MKIATILPTAHLWMENGEEYHLCLAHQMNNWAYEFFFRKQVRGGKFVILDNGAAENGVPMKIDSLLSVVRMLGCQEMVLPDVIHDAEATMRLSHEAFTKANRMMPTLNLMGVPHGKNIDEWTSCAVEMCSWGVDTIGISKFIVPDLFPSRIWALDIISNLNLLRNVRIHLLGYTGVRREMAEINRLFPDRVEGVDSSISTLYAQIGQEMKIGRPDVKLDLDITLNNKLLSRNIRIWKEEVHESPSVLH